MRPELTRRTSPARAGRARRYASLQRVARPGLARWSVVALGQRLLPFRGVEGAPRDRAGAARPTGRSNVPQITAARTGGDDEVRAAVDELHRGWALAGAAEEHRAEWPARGNIPEACYAVDRCRGQRAAVRAEGYADQVGLAPHRLATPFPVGGVVEPRPPLPVGVGVQRAVGREHSRLV